MKSYNYKCVVAKNGAKMYYKRVGGKWKRITTKIGEKAEKGKRKYNMIEGDLFAVMDPLSDSRHLTWADLIRMRGEDLHNSNLNAEIKKRERNAMEILNIKCDVKKIFEVLEKQYGKNWARRLLPRFLPKLIIKSIQSNNIIELEKLLKIYKEFGLVEKISPRIYDFFTIALKDDDGNVCEERPTECTIKDVNILVKMFNLLTEYGVDIKNIKEEFPSIYSTISETELGEHGGVTNEENLKRYEGWSLFFRALDIHFGENYFTDVDIRQGLIDAELDPEYLEVGGISPLIGWDEEEEERIKEFSREIGVIFNKWRDQYIEEV